MNKAHVFLVIALFFAVQNANGQNTGILIGQDTTRRVITTAVPFMTIAPDARSGALGDAGVALSPDANSIHWNIAKLAFIEDDFGFSLSYTPWLARIINDMSISFLSGYYKINREQSVSAALRYFDLGGMQFTDELGGVIGDFRPRELSLEGSYARMLTENMSIGVTMKMIYSNLTGNVYGGTDDSRAGVSVGGDIGWFYQNDLNLGARKNSLALGASITNIGSKLTYSNENQRQFVPTNLRVGGAYTTELDPYNKFTFVLDFNKLMVPTPPVYRIDQNGNIARDSEDNPIINRGKDPNRPFLSGIFGSFADAPDGFREEIQEIMISSGIEYWYNNVFAARFGYYWEHENKGDRKFFTTGLGMRYNTFGLDVAYLIPTRINHPLAETLRFTIHFNFNKGKQADSIQDQRNTISN
jgi:hypothetical protein